MGLRDYSTQERLNKMNVELVDREILGIDDGNAYLSDDLFFLPVAVPIIENAKNSSIIIQSVAVIGQSADGDETGDFDIVVLSANPGLLKAGPALMEVNDPMSGNTTAHEFMDAFCGVINITNMTDVGTTSVIGSATNIGMVVKPEVEGAIYMYIFGIARAAATWSSSTMTIRFGIVRD